MGLVYEEILRRFSEDTNTSSGEYYTPRDVVKLLVELILEPEKDKLNKNNLVRVYMIHVVELEVCYYK